MGDNFLSPRHGEGRDIHAGFYGYEPPAQGYNCNYSLESQDRDPILCPGYVLVSGRLGRASG